MMGLHEASSRSIRDRMEDARQKDYITVEECALLVSVSERTIWRRLAEEKLGTPVRDGRIVRVNRRAAQRFFQYQDARAADTYPLDGDDMNDAGWVSLSDYASIYGVHRNTVQKWRAAGLLTCWRTARTVRVKNMPPRPASDVASAPAVPAPPMPDRSIGVLRRDAKLSRSSIRVNGQAVPDVPGVYVLRSGVAAKIGYSANLRRRLLTLRTAQLALLPILGYVTFETPDAAYQMEQELFAKCEGEHIRGEWYRLTPAVVAILRAACSTWDASALLEHPNPETVSERHNTPQVALPRTSQ